MTMYGCSHGRSEVFCCFLSRCPYVTMFYKTFRFARVHTIALLSLGRIFIFIFSVETLCMLYVRVSEVCVDNDEEVKERMKGKRESDEARWSHLHIKYYTRKLMMRFLSILTWGILSFCENHFNLAMNFAMSKDLLHVTFKCIGMYTPYYI